MVFVDLIQQFIDEQCIVSNNVVSTKTELYEFFQLWNLGGPPVSKMLFFKLFTGILHGKVKEYRPRVDGERPRMLYGVCLK